MNKFKKVISLSIFTSSLLSSIYAEDSINLETITVTAQKSEENVQNVPISISVFNEISLEDKSISTIDDIPKYTPNLLFFNGAKKGLTAPSIRGIYANVSSFSSPVSMYVDGVPFLNSMGFADDLMDIERVEVLRGPQGTLYGKNSEAGVINIVSKKPNNEIKSKVLLKVANDGKKQIGVNVSGPIIEDTFYAGISYKHDEKDGYIKNTFYNEYINDKESDYAKIRLRYTPTDDLDISFISSRHENNDGSLDWALAGQDEPSVASNLKGLNETLTKMAALNIDYSIDDSSKIKSISTIRQYSEYNESDSDFTSETISHLYKYSEFNTISQEIRYEKDFDKAKIVLGTYLDKTDDKWDAKFVRTLGESKKVQDMESNSISFFTTLFYTLNDKWSFNTGLRYDREKKTQDIETMSLYQEKTWENFSPKFSLQHSFNDKQMAYFSVAKGYRSGGFSHLGIDGGISYDEENLISYELGYKSMFWDNRLRLNSSIYFMDITDMQVEEVYAPGITYMSNAAEATSKGLELELEALLTNEITLFTSLGLNKTTFDSFTESGKDYSGNYNPYAPKYNFNIGLQYRANNGFYGRVDVNGYGKTFYDKENIYAKDAYELVNLKVGYELDKFDVYLYANNLFDEKYDATNAYFYGTTTVYKESREIGVQLTYRF